MKNLLCFITVAFILSFKVYANVDVTFRVNMQGQTISPNGIHLAGNFNFNPFPVYPEWNPSGIELTDIDSDGVYEVTLSLNEGYYFEYKFINGNDWPFAELLPSECQNNGNRFVNVGIANELLSVVCFALCSDCIQPGCTNPSAVNFDATANVDNASCLFEVGLAVDMNYYPTLVNSVSVIGSFNGWDNTLNPMTDGDADGIWTIVLVLPNGSYEYLFNIPELTETENMNAADPCVIGNNGFYNREFLVNDGPFDLPFYCWNSCFSCASVEIVFSVNMVGETVAPEGVFLAGSFNGWLPTLMTDNGNGVWSLSWNLQNGNYYTYKFVNGDDLDTEAENFSGDCTTGVLQDRFLTAPFDAAVLPTVCYNECSECPITVNVRFRLDMANETVAQEGVHMAGSFQGWDPSTTPLNYIGYTIYEITLALSPYTFFEYKFINGNAWGQDENLSSDCTINFNRFFTTGFQDVELPMVCFNQCGMCAGCTDPFAAEYSPFAVIDDGSCNSPMIWACTYPNANNYNEDADIDDGSCLFPPTEDVCPADFNDDGVVGVSDLLAFISVYGTTCQ